MTDEQINAAIAEACGRKRRPDGDWYPDNGTVGTQAIRDYCNCLNAMHEAEKMLTENQDQMMGFWLSHICKLGTRWRATARERAEAFLRTLGKWEGD